MKKNKEKRLKTACYSLNCVYLEKMDVHSGVLRRAGRRTVGILHKYALLWRETWERVVFLRQTSFWEKLFLYKCMDL